MISATAKFLYKLGISADVLTILGLFLSAVTAGLVYHGFLFTAGCVALTSGVCDLLDGSVARLNPNRSVFGALLDSSLDRYSDVLLFGSVLFYFVRVQEPVYAMLAFSACAAAFEVSYVRARAEGLGFACQVGFWERPERLGVLFVSLWFNNLPVGMVLLGAFPHLTAIARLDHIRRVVVQNTNAGVISGPPSKRQNPLYWLEVSALIFIIIFLKLRK